MRNTDLLTTAQVAALTGRDVATINRWAVSGRLPIAYKMPGRTGSHLFRREDVDRVTEQVAA